jgi:hypothetical protein
MRPNIFNVLSAAVVAVALSTVSFTVPAWGQTSSSTSANGTANSGAGKTAGNPNTGAWSDGGSQGSYGAGGAHYAAGSTDSSTKAKATFAVTPNGQSSFASGETKVDSFALGAPRNTATSISGTDQQADYASKSTSKVNGASAGNTTWGNLSGSGKGTSFVRGAIHTSGGTWTVAHQGPTHASNSYQTNGSSKSVVSGFELPTQCGRPNAPQSNVAVGGSGSGGGESFLGGGQNYAGANNMGNAAYSASGQHDAQGSLGVQGTTSASLTGNVARSASSQSSYAEAHH